MTSFKVASTARRLDRESGKWVDGNSLRVRVNCWRGLADGVAQSIMLGDPVIVHGRLYTRDWVDNLGTHRTLYELEAIAVGHDYSRGKARFARNRPITATSANEPSDEIRIAGEPTSRMVGERPGLSAVDSLHDTDAAFAEAVAGFGNTDSLNILREVGLDPQVIESYLRAAAENEGDPDGAEGDSDDHSDDDQPIDPAADEPVAGTRSRRRREPVPA